jgi:P27 family predicted phage terminase small subunit
LQPGCIPAKPPQLSAAAGVEWDRLAEDLAQAGLLNARFLMAFAGYCECVAEYWAHKRTIAKEGYMAETPNGCAIQHPAVGMMGKCLDRMVKLERELGLTPAAATGLQPGSEGSEDPLDLLARMRSQAPANPPPAPRRTRKTSRGTSKV